MVISPPKISTLSPELEVMCHGNIEKMQDVARHLKDLSTARNTHFMDTMDWLTPSDVDGVHLDEQGHELLRRKLADKLITLDF